MFSFFAYIISAVRANHQIVNLAATEGNSLGEDVPWTNADLEFLERLVSFDPDQLTTSPGKERAVS